MGAFQRFPGFDEQYRFSLLPFWGNHCLIDFMLASVNAGKSKDAEVTVILSESSRSTALSLASRWKKQVARVHSLEGGLQELGQLVAASTAEAVVFASLSSVCILDPGALLGCAAGAGEQVVKVSIAHTPLEMYCAQKRTMSQLLETGAARSSGKKRLRESLFEDVLHPAIDLIEDLPGEILFQNDLMEYYAANIWVAANSESVRYHRIISRLPELADRDAESHVAEKGSIRNSWLASGVEVEGAVEDSIIFPNVVIRRNALVSRSVVLNGNRIGAGTEIRGALILPFTTDVPRTSPNIGDNCSIGAKSSTMTNIDFPAQIRNGITLIGTNADIPNGFHAEAASCVGPGVPAAALRRLKVLRKGFSVLAGQPVAPPERPAASRSRK